MFTARIAGYAFQVPHSVQGQGRRAVCEWLADELTSKQLVPFNPLAVSLEELEEAVGDIEDPAALDAMFAVEWRGGGREILRARRRALDTIEED